MPVAEHWNLYSKNIFLGHDDAHPGLESLKTIEIKETKENQKRLTEEITFERGLEDK